MSLIDSHCIERRKKDSFIILRTLLPSQHDIRKHDMMVRDDYIGILRILPCLIIETLAYEWAESSYAAFSFCGDFAEYLKKPGIPYFLFQPCLCIVNPLRESPYRSIIFLLMPEIIPSEYAEIVAPSIKGRDIESSAKRILHRRNISTEKLVHERKSACRYYFLAEPFLCPEQKRDYISIALACTCAGLDYRMLRIIKGFLDKLCHAFLTRPVPE